VIYNSEQRSDTAVCNFYIILTCLQSDSKICCMCTTVSSWRWAHEARNMWRRILFYE